jgi:uncharacterized damage-inducible protein DinB
MKEPEKIIRQLEDSFNGNAWYGSPVMEVLTGVTPEIASGRVSDNTHSIVELVLHMAAWRNFVVWKLKGVAFEMTEELNYPKPIEWPMAVSLLEQSQQGLITAIQSFPEQELSKQVPNRKYDFSHLLYGIIQHDIYHLGQIALLKKALL